MAIDRLTRSERATYQAMRARGYDHEDALNDALDGVSVDQARKMPSRTATVPAAAPILYHATTLGRLGAILRDGLVPGAPASGFTAGSGRVHLHEEPGYCRQLVEMSHLPAEVQVVVLRVDAEGLELGHGDDDDEREFATALVVEPWRIEVTEL